MTLILSCPILFCMNKRHSKLIIPSDTINCNSHALFQIKESSDTLFNKGAAMNVGFLEIERLFRPDCYIFHDVDLIPFDDRNLYLCNVTNPRHLGVHIDHWNFQ